MAAVEMDTRARVVNKLHDPIRDMVVAIDRLEKAIADGENARSAATALFEARDAYLKPMVERAESGEE